MGPTWGPPGSCQPQMGPMLAQWTLLSGKSTLVQVMSQLHCHAVCDILLHWNISYQRSIIRLSSLLPTNAIGQHKAGSTLAQVMACWLTAPSHYMNQCWLGSMCHMASPGQSQLIATKVFICFKLHDDVIKWKRFLHYWPFVWGIYRWQVNCPHKGQWRRAFMCSLICAWINGWTVMRLVIWEAIALIMMSL